MAKMPPFMGDRVQATIAAIYDAAMDSERLPEVLDGIAALIGGKGMLMGPLAPTPTPDPALVGYASEPFHEAVADYVANWVAVNPRRRWLLDNDHAERIFVDHDIMAEAQLRRHPFYNDFLRRHGNLYCLDRITSQLGGDRRLWISVQYADGAPPPTTADRNLFEMLSSHLLQSLSMFRLMNQLRPHEADLIDRYDCAAMILSAEGRILHMNRQAEALDGRGLKLTRGWLSAASPRHADQLRRLLGDALRTGGGESVAPMAAIEWNDGGAPLLLRAVPLGRESADRLASSLVGEVPRILLLGWDRASERTRSTESVLRLFGLTPTEARLANLVGSGLSPEEAAEKAGITLATARQHLKRCHEKLDIRRQADLVRMVSRLSAFGDEAR